ncbi:transposase, partial [Belnapia sp. T18]|nr:transposase [Belnapia arida]
SCSPSRSSSGSNPYLRTDHFKGGGSAGAGQTDRSRRQGKDNRPSLEAMLWRVRTGAPWRDLPSAFSKWNSGFQRFRCRVKGNVFERVLTCLSGDRTLNMS